MVAERRATAAEHARVQVQGEYFDNGAIGVTDVLRRPQLRTVEPRQDVTGEARPFLTGDAGLIVASRFKIAFKRLVDLVLSIVFITLLLPVIAATAFAVALTSEGPVIFSQERVGKGNRRFRVLKFRSMQVTAEDDREALDDLNEAEGPVFKIQEDPRITPIGKFIRKLSLDELPQLWNVVRGDMSLVGPRPPLPDEVDEYTTWERQRLLVQPGITGIWQVSGRSDLDFETWVSMDIQYIQDWHPMLDLALLIKTVPAVLSGRGAY